MLKFLQTKNSGATAVCALLYDKTLYIAWAGDSQAALIKNGRGINLTIPHKPEREVSLKSFNLSIFNVAITNITQIIIQHNLAVHFAQKSYSSWIRFYSRRRVYNHYV